MTTANVVALLVVAGSYLLYSRLLTPAEFGIYAGALAIARLGQTVLDGGLKIVLVKHAQAVGPGVLRALLAVRSTLAWRQCCAMEGVVFLRQAPQRQPPVLC